MSLSPSISFSFSTSLCFFLLFEKIASEGTGNCVFPSLHSCNNKVPSNKHFFFFNDFDNWRNNPVLQN